MAYTFSRLIASQNAKSENLTFTFSLFLSYRDSLFIHVLIDFTFNFKFLICSCKLQGCSWQHVNVSGPFPDNMVRGGVDADGAIIYIGRAFHEGEITHSMSMINNFITLDIFLNIFFSRRHDPSQSNSRQKHGMRVLWR